jgi:hypothetical protein
MRSISAQVCLSARHRMKRLIEIYAEGLPTAMREMCLDVVRQALVAARLSSETWSVAIVLADAGVALEFRLGAASPKSLAVVLQDGAASRPRLYGTTSVTGSKGSR